MATVKSRCQSIKPLLWVMLFDHTCLNIAFPVLTLLFFDSHSLLFAADTPLSVRSSWYGMCVAVPYVINLITTPLLSAISDEYGRKNVLIIGTFGALLFAVVAGLGVLWGSLWLLFIGRMIQGAFSRTNPVGQAVIGDISPPQLKVRHMGYLQTAIALGACIGPVIGGYTANPQGFDHFHFSLPFFIAAIAALVSFILTLTLFKETLNKSAATPRLNFLHYQTYRSLLGNKAVRQISILLFFSQISWSLYYQFVPPVLKTVLHFDATKLGLFVSMIAFWLALATTFGIRLLQRYYDLAQMLLFALIIFGVGLVSTLIASSYPQSWYAQFGMWLAAIPTAVGDVVAYSCIITLYSNVVNKREQGRVMGACFVIIASVWAITGFTGGRLMGLHTVAPLMVAPLGVMLALLCYRSNTVTFAKS